MILTFDTLSFFNLKLLILLKQEWQCSPGKEVAWNVLSLFTGSGMLCLEISLMAFLLNDNYMNAMEAMTHTTIVSGIIVVVDTLLKVRLIFHICYVHACACIFSSFVKYQWNFMIDPCLVSNFFFKEKE